MQQDNVLPKNELQIMSDMLGISAPQVTPKVTPEVKKMLKYLKEPLSRRDLQEKMTLKDDEHFRKSYLDPAIEADFIEMAIPDKPTSSKQKYRLTQKGRSVIGPLINTTPGEK